MMPVHKILTIGALLLIDPALSTAAETAAAYVTAESGVVGMCRIPPGVYQPLFRTPGEPKQIQVKAFYLDATPVTLGEFLEFVRANSQWARSAVKRLFADEAYLQNWADDFNPGPGGLDKPVTFVSWFAARAYAQWKGKRLPTVAEWEYVALASATQADGSADSSFKQQVLQWYVAPQSELANVAVRAANMWGVHDLHGLIWEWVLDFNGALLSSDSRADNGLSAGLFCGGGAQRAKNVSDYPAFMRTGFRSSLKANYCIHNLGFRCAKDL